MQRAQRAPRMRRALTFVTFFSSVSLCVLVAQTPSAFDVIVRGGTVVDGTGVPRYRADVAIVNGFIARVGDLSSANASTEIDATDLFVAPGFINIHSHA